MKRPERTITEYEFVEVIPPLCVNNQVDVRQLLLLGQASEPPVEERWVGDSCRQRDERARDHLKVVLPLHAALLLSDAVHLVKNYPLEALYPILVGARHQQHLQNVWNRHQDLAILPFPLFGDTSCSIELPQEAPEQLSSRVRRVIFAREAGVDLSTDLVDQRLRRSHVDGHAVVILSQDLVHDVIPDEGFATRRRGHNQRGPFRVHDVQELPLPAVGLEIDAAEGVLRCADGAGHMGTKVHQLEGVLVIADTGPD
mmetsp:Transcript_62394/g.177313  ORF Transcript_62394/g.177313 Transcript_62394/m.177313 type:complete len:256 (-) Transcript_62394:444-1211(-)